MQSKTHSALEAIIGTAIGFAISWALLTFLIVPVFHLRTNVQEDFLITCIFTVASVLRSYGVRRFFNWWHYRQRAEYGPVVSYLGRVPVQPPQHLSLVEQLQWIEDYEMRVQQAALQQSEINSD